MKKKLAILLCAAITITTLTACGGSSPGKSKAGAGGKQKLVLSTYGLSEDISAQEVYAPFEEEFSCEIVTETGGTNDRYTKLAADRESAVDVIELSQAMTVKGMEDGLFLDIDLNKINNANDMITSAKTMAESGQGLAYTINSIGIMYNPDAIDFEIRSFDDLWDPRLKGMVSVPEITTTFGPSIVYMASDYAGVDIKSDNAQAAFKALSELKPNLVKTYNKSSDLINMFTSGEAAVAVVGNFGVPAIQAANPDLVYITPDTTYANFNTISITKNCKNKELAYAYLNYRLSPELQTKAGKALNEAPTNNKVKFTAKESQNMTYGEKAEHAKVLDYTFVNPLLNNWIDQWNRIINN